MQLLVTQAAMVVVVIASVLVPGWSLGVLVRADRSAAPTQLRGAWTVLLGIGWASIATALALGLGVDRVVVAALVYLPLVPALVVLARRRELRAVVPARSRVLLHAWAALVAALVGAWGTTFRSDGTYHAAAIEKLARLDGVTPGRLSLFPDHEPIPALLVPAWHQLLALAAQLPWVEFAGVTALWSAAGAAAWLLVLVAAGSGRVATGSDHGGWLAAAVTPLVLLAPVGGAAPLLQTLGFPGNVVLFVVLPAVLATVAWRAGRSERDRTGADPRAPWIAALVLGCVAVCAIHVTYVYYVAAVGVGMVVAAWLVERGAARRLLLPAAVVAGTVAVLVALQLPALTGHAEFARGTAGDEGALVRQTWSAVLADGGFAIRGSWFLAQGAMFTIGLLASALVLPLVRRRRVEAALLVVVPVLVLGALARTGPVAEALAGLGSFPPVPRSPRLLQAPLAIVVVACALDERFDVRRRAGLVVGAALAAALLVVAAVAPTGRLGEDLGDGHRALVPGAAFDLLLVVLLVELVVVAVRVRRAGGRGGEAPAVATSAASVSRGMAALLVAVAGLAFAVGAIDELRVRPAHVTEAEGLADGDVFDRDWFAVMRQLAPGTVVLADSRVSLRVAAVAPVYVTSTAKNQLSTPAREQAFADFLDPSTPDAERLQYLREQGIDVVVFPGPTRFVRTTSGLLAGDSGWRAHLDGERLRLYCRGACGSIPAAWRGGLRPIEPRQG